MLVDGPTRGPADLGAPLVDHLCRRQISVPGGDPGLTTLGGTVSLPASRVAGCLAFSLHHCYFLKVLLSKV
jgi:hypothetical protein